MSDALDHSRRVDAMALLTREERATIAVAFSNTDGVQDEALDSRAQILSAIKDANKADIS